MDLRQYALTIIREQIHQQFDSCSYIDNKASWLLGFLAIVFTVFFATQKSSVSHCTLVVVGVVLLLSFILAVVCLLVPPNLEMSPGVEPFRDFVEENIDSPGVTADLVKKLSNDHVDNFNRNARKLICKKRFLYAGYLLLLAALLIMFIEAI